ncbi:hypothetical protein LR948_15985 [Roseivivax sp. GX 12232]|uniref:hypothetical protein n=1 Tax=Roseivivax sp. GX 12232 TaxID=2900547 RepID=UPI001E621320|nr:hypothetical protein [Roseivivax sp. GX 12232]MCE0506872.1 hypothetical protein [Roseivivax sp. GX 12232]
MMVLARLSYFAGFAPAPLAPAQAPVEPLRSPERPTASAETETRGGGDTRRQAPVPLSAGQPDPVDLMLNPDDNVAPPSILQLRIAALLNAQTESAQSDKAEEDKARTAEAQAAPAPEKTARPAETPARQDPSTPKPTTEQDASLVQLLSQPVRAADPYAAPPL